MSIVVNGIPTNARDLKNIFKTVMETATCTPEQKEAIEIMFDTAVLAPERFTKRADAKRDITEYLTKWVANFINSLNNPPSKTVAKAKQAPTDPALRKMIQAMFGYDDEAADGAEELHDLFMAAENIQGGLLEEYIFSKAKAYGWVWCAGNSLRAIDFLKYEGRQVYLVQIKNKYNTENSSSSAIREGTTVEKWFRIGRKVRKGVVTPDFRWDELNVKMGMPEDNEFSERDYQAFLVRCITENPGLLKGKSN